MNQELANQSKLPVMELIFHPYGFLAATKFLAIKADKLIQLDVTESEEKVFHSLSDSTILLGFHKRDANSILILQGSVPAVLLLASGKITLVPYDDKEESTDRKALDQLRSNLNSYRNYGNTTVSIEKQEIKIWNGELKEKLCPVNCTQPALTEDGKSWFLSINNKKRNNF